MSFDLLFCWQTDARLDTARFCDFFAGTPTFQINHLKDGNIQIWYENECTGVYFSFESGSDPADPEANLILPSGFFDAGIAFNLNFNRPCFFAHEAMPWVETFANTLGLWIVDPQEDWDAEPSVPKHYNADELTASWERHNSWAVNALHDKSKSVEEIDYRYCPREKSLYWWTYTRGKEKLQKKLGGSVFVPSMSFFTKGNDPRILTGIIWSDALSHVFPEADIVIHNRMGRNWRGERVTKKIQVLSSEELLPKVEHLLAPCESAVPGLRYLRPEDTNEIRKVFEGCKGASFEEYNSIASDAFVDVPLAQ